MATPRSKSKLLSDVTRYLGLLLGASVLLGGLSLWSGHKKVSQPRVGILVTQELEGQLAHSALPVVELSCRERLHDLIRVRCSLQVFERGQAITSKMKATVKLTGQGSTPKPDLSIVLKRDKDLLDLGVGDQWALYGDFGDPTLIRRRLSAQLWSAISDTPYWFRSRSVEVKLDGLYAGVFTLAPRPGREALGLRSFDPLGPANDYAVKVERLGSYRRAASGAGAHAGSKVQYEVEQVFPDLVRTSVSRVSVIQDLLDRNVGLDSYREISLGSEGYRIQLSRESVVRAFLYSTLLGDHDNSDWLMVWSEERENTLGSVRVLPLVGVDTFGADWEDLILWRNQLELKAPMDRWLRDAQALKEVKSKWKTLRSDVLTEEHVHALVDKIAVELAEPRTRDELSWPRDETSAGSLRTLAPAQGIAYIHAWLKRRLRYMDFVLGAL